jgi:subtilisin family serine protease
MGRRRVLIIPILVAASAVAEAGPVRRQERPIPGSYIVVLREDAARAPDDAFSRQPSVEELATEMVDIPGLGRRKHVYQHALRGFSIEATAEEAERLADDSRVAFVEEDGVVEASIVQSSPTWGLDRVDQRALPLSHSYTYNQSGAGVHAYVIDTGLRATHVQFTGRVGGGFTAISDGKGSGDCNGHGTHVAGTIGGSTTGVAKAVTLHPVRVLDCSGAGTISAVIAGVDWVTAHRVRPAVANMSLGGSPSAALDAAVASSIAAGVTYAVAAGNSNASACTQSPARLAAALTVGATTSTDARASFSNYGSCVDMFAPGSGITSAWNTSDTATTSLSGTSMATPHVTGAAALYLQGHASASPAQVAQAVIAQATLNRVTSAGTGSPNRLLYTLFPASGSTDVTVPGVSITSPGTGSTLKSSVGVAASASDNSGMVEEVEFFVDGALKATDKAAPFAFTWDTRTVGDGTHTLTAKAYDPTGNVGTSHAVSVAVKNATTTTSAAELVKNGGFEGSAAYWGLSGNARFSTAGYSHGGTGYTALGVDSSSTGAMYQTIAIPATAPAQLSFWLNITSADTGSVRHDQMFVEVRDTSGALLASLGEFSNLSRGTVGVYSQKFFSVAAFRGKTVRVQFRATTDGSLATAFRVDDVSLR